MSKERVQEQVEGGLKFSDDFTDSRTPGTVIGSLSTSGERRLGVDVEGVLSIDNGALRIAPLLDAGFGRAVLAYGPFARQPGLAFAVYMINGHNTSQAEPLSDTLRKRLDYWFKGSGTDRRRERLVQWLLSRRIRRTLRQFRRWKRTAKDKISVPSLDENLAVGWFPSATVPDPRVKGNGFIMHALGPENGELWVGETASRTRALRGVQNVPIYYVVVARSEGAVYYVSSVEGAVGLPPHPWLRPVAVDAGPLTDEMYVGIHQSVLGQIGWRLDTRIYGVRVAHITGYDSWYGGAHAADKLVSEELQAGTLAEKGGKWQVWARRSENGDATPSHPETERFALLDPGAPSGLVHASATVGGDSPARVGLLWRFLDKHNHWRLELSARACEIVFVTGGKRETLASREYPPSSVSSRRLQILDDGDHLMAYVDGEPLSDKWIMDTRLHTASKVGICLNTQKQSQAALHSFEAHPRQLRLPNILDMGAPWLRKGTQVVIADDFAGEAGDLEGRTTPIGGGRWRRIIGKGIIETTGSGVAHVRASVHEPCPGRTVYCVDWPHPDFVDMEVTITPPGSRQGEQQRTTAGFILYQDPRNYVTLNAYRSDYYPAGSVSTFFKFGGFEDVYDAVWSNVADRINYGRPLRLKLCCDGERYLVFINDETVLFRAFRDVYPEADRLLIRKVGIIANWEFGTDTGSKFEQFSLHV